MLDLIVVFSGVKPNVGDDIAKLCLKKDYRYDGRILLGSDDPQKTAEEWLKYAGRWRKNSGVLGEVVSGDVSHNPNFIDFFYKKGCKCILKKDLDFDKIISDSQNGNFFGLKSRGVSIDVSNSELKEQFRVLCDYWERRYLKVVEDPIYEI